MRIPLLDEQHRGVLSLETSRPRLYGLLKFMFDAKHTLFCWAYCWRPTFLRINTNIIPIFTQLFSFRRHTTSSQSTISSGPKYIFRQKFIASR